MHPVALLRNTISVPDLLLRIINWGLIDYTKHCISSTWWASWWILCVDHMRVWVPQCFLWHLQTLLHGFLSFIQLKQAASRQFRINDKKSCNRNTVGMHSPLFSFLQWSNHSRYVKQLQFQMGCRILTYFTTPHTFWNLRREQCNKETTPNRNVRASQK